MDNLYSKQFIDLTKKDESWDFDIFEEAAYLEPDSYIELGCNGLGFILIGKSKEEEVLLGMPVEKHENNIITVQWNTLEEVIEKWKILKN